MKKTTRQSKAMKAYWADPLRGGKRKKLPSMDGLNKLTKKYHRQGLVDHVVSTTSPAYAFKFDEPGQWKTGTFTPTTNGLAGTKAFVKNFVVDQCKEISFQDDGSVVLRMS